jgi:type IV pilus assembly protein PilC
MPQFHYQAIDARGDEHTGRLEAASAEQVAAGLKEKGLHPTEIKPVVTASASVGKPVSPTRSLQAFALFKPLTARELALFTRQLATLLRAGMPLLRALEVLDRQEKNVRMKKMLLALAEGIRSGGTLSDAMARHGRVFDRLYLNMVRAGEAGGALDLVFERLAGFQEKSQQLRGKVRAAMVYPLVVLVVAASILAGLLVFVVPKFKQIFADLLKGAPLPPLTRAVLAVSEGARAHWIGLLAGASVCGLVYHLGHRHPAGRRMLDRLVLRLPVFGELALKTLVARFSRTLGTLLSSGVPVLQALTIARDTCGNLRVAGAIGVVHDRVKEGEPMARPLEGTRVFPPMVPSLIEVGEHTGQLPEMLGKVADIFDGEVDTTVAGLSSLLEPAMVVFLATVVGVIVVALFLPLVRIVQLMS